MIIGFEIEKVDASRFVEVVEIASTAKINVNVDIKLTHARMTSSHVTGGEVLTADYSLTVNYLNPEVGLIRFAGRIHYTGPDAQDASEKWDKKDVAPKAKLEMTNGVLSQMAPMMMMLAHQMSLPSPVQVPIIGAVPSQPARTDDSHYHG